MAGKRKKPQKENFFDWHDDAKRQKLKDLGWRMSPEKFRGRHLWVAPGGRVVSECTAFQCLENDK
jgi:8-oxo-dGTP pyrophosphatase MutT (NUDIX family)